MTVRHPLVTVGGAMQELVAADTIARWSHLPEQSRRLSWSNGGQGAIGTVTSVTAGSFRLAVRLPVTTVQWRLKISNYDTYATASKTALTGKKIIHGDHNRSLTSPAAESGDFVGSTATTIVSSDFTIPGDGTQYTSPWVTAAGDQFDADTEHLIAIGYTSSSQTLQCGAGRCWRWTSSTAGTDPTQAASGATSTTSFVPLDVVLEYDTVGRMPAFLVIADSIPEGVSGVKGAGQTATSINNSPINQWGWLNNIHVQNHSLYGITAQSMASSSHRAWTRQDTSLGLFDGAILALGTNDIDLSRTAANIQTDLMSCVTNIRTIIGTSKPIYAMNMLARNFTGTPETTRTTVNEWLGTIPTGFRGLADADSTMRRNSATVSDTALICTDNTHPTHVGQAVLANMLTSVIRL